MLHVLLPGCPNADHSSYQCDTSEQYEIFISGSGSCDVTPVHRQANDCCKEIPGLASPVWSLRRARLQQFSCQSLHVDSPQGRTFDQALSNDLEYSVDPSRFPPGELLQLVPPALMPINEPVRRGRPEDHAISPFPSPSSSFSNP